jgi:hypothetical protein
MRLAGLVNLFLFLLAQTMYAESGPYVQGLPVVQDRTGVRSQLHFRCGPVSRCGARQEICRTTLSIHCIVVAAYLIEAGEINVHTTYRRL